MDQWPEDHSLLPRPPRLIVIDPSLQGLEENTATGASMMHSKRHARNGSNSDNDSSTQNTPRGGSVNGNGPKTGRKGDPRMHRSVAARLANPELTLFQALQVGGFDYTQDDDANSADHEGVTLGQRKNQLSRRLRQARKHTYPGSEESTQPARDRKRRGHDSLLDEELEECRKDASGYKKQEVEHVILAKNHADFGHSIIAQSNMAQKPAGVPNPVYNRSGGSGYSNRLPQQVTVKHEASSGYQPAVDVHQHGAPSGVAMATLRSVAQSLGMTLEQLALALSSSDNLLQALTTTDSQKRKKQQELACNLYANELQALIQKSMLLAGYSVDQAQEGTPCNLDFSFLAWQQEGRRLKALYNQKYINEPPIQQAMDQVMAARTGEVLKQNSPPSRHHEDGDDGHAHSHGHAHAHAHSHQEPHDDCAFHDGRHIHRLEGKCGHKAILHQPENGNAHIDFVVGNKVECYAGVQPLGNTTQNISVWPSQYKCQDLSCKSACSHSITQEHQHNDDCSTLHNPRILDLDDVDFTGQEWNTEFANDETLLGLFKLSDSKTTLSRTGSESVLDAASTVSGIGLGGDIGNV